MSSGTEFLTSNAQISYPFKEDATGLSRDVSVVRSASTVSPIVPSLPAYGQPLVNAFATVPAATTGVYLHTVSYVSSVGAVGFVTSAVFQFVFTDASATTLITGTIDTLNLDPLTQYTPVTMTTGVYSVRLFVDTLELTKYLIYLAELELVTPGDGTVTYVIAAAHNIMTHYVLQTMPVSVAVDALAYAASPATDLYLDYIVFNTGTTWRFVFSDASYTAVIDAQLDISTLDPTSTYSVLTFVGSAASLKLTVLTSNFLAYITGCTADVYVHTLQLERRVVDYARLKLNSLITPGVVAGRVQLVDGYNSQFTAEDLGNDTTGITLDLSPGSGLGVYPCASQTPVVTRGPMGLVPDDAGNIRFVGGDDQCYSIIPNPGDPNGFLITSSCVACCSCEDYANVTLALRQSLNKASLALKKLNTGRTTYQTGVTWFNNPIATRFIGPKVFASGYAGFARRTLETATSGVDHGSPGWANITIQVQNNTPGILTITGASITLGQPHMTKSVHWTLDGQGGQSSTLAGAGVAAGAMAMGKQVVFSASILYNGVTLTPINWTGSVSVDVHIAPPVGATWTAYNVTGLTVALDF